MLQEQHSKRVSAYIGLVLVVLGTWVGFTLLARVLPGFPYEREIQWGLLMVNVILAFAGILCWCVSHHINRGIRYAFAHTKMVRNVKTALLDAGYYYQKQYSNEEIVAVLPKVKVEFDKDLLGGKLYIRNNLLIQKKLEDKDISSALGDYICEEQYTTNDKNWFVYEFVNANVDNQLEFNSYNGFVAYTKQFGSYRLCLDKRNVVTVTSTLLSGVTGSGKTYALYSMVLQSLNWKIKPEFYFADPKGSSFAVFGKKVAPQQTAENIEDIIALLKEFCQKMEVRKKQLKKRLEQRLDSDYRAFNLPAMIFVIDEFSSFQSAINTMDKKTRDQVAMYLRSIVLQGRQLGALIWFVAQKADATDIPTAIRDNLIFKCVLGNAPQTTYLTTFEVGANLPKRKFKEGQGLYSYQGLTRQPQIVSFPTLNFDINKAAKDQGKGYPVM